MNTFTLTGQLVDLVQEKIYPAEVAVEQGRIRAVTPLPSKDTADLPYLMPGFVDAHVHIESSMLVPSEFARLAVVHGTVATVSDPHEIANVMGMDGVDFMLQNAAKTPFRFCFGAPSCVPATPFETAGAELTPAAVEQLLQRSEIGYLSEMMNFPGVLAGDEAVLAKIAAARKHGKPVDGHAPGLRGTAAEQYARGGLPDGQLAITTDHECFTREEALDKLRCGMKILIREGSAARNFEALADLLYDYPNQMMFCSDDKHPDSLVAGHINTLVKRACAKGIPLMHVLKAACLNPVLHYKLNSGLLQRGDAADFIVVSDLREFCVLQTYIAGIRVAENGKTLIAPVPVTAVNNFHCAPVKPPDFVITAPPGENITVIEALDGQLITNRLTLPGKREGGLLVSDPDRDLLKITVVNRYREAPPSVAFIRNFGLKRGALASSVAHDSHNIIAVGVSDEDICAAVNLIVRHRGGVCVTDGERQEILPLPVAGLMSTEDGYEVAEKYAALDRLAKALGSGLQAPFMTLSFMALLVIPHLKLSDKGLFDGDRFAFTAVAPA
ncbi:adenine deaminase [Compostibacter hankyongensis]|uniref:Adenine deaminase n=1 Tax=Compostibacter hankyongensis TaxID=1007089 RepID=A0ABP8GAQ6_9BACT